MEERIWYVRSEEGAVYGPATFATLVDWVKEGRIAPSGHVSKDRVNWIPPQTLDALEMKWLVETEPGSFFGPFHRELVKKLVADGSVPASARIYRSWDLPVDKDPEPVVIEKIVEKIVEKPVEKIVEKVVEKIVVKEVAPAPRAPIVVPDVVEVIDTPPPRPTLGGIFKGADPESLAALEAAAMKELAAARKFGVGGIFGRK